MDLTSAVGVRECRHFGEPFAVTHTATIEDPPSPENPIVGAVVATVVTGGIAVELIPASAVAVSVGAGLTSATASVAGTILDCTDHDPSSSCAGSVAEEGASVVAYLAGARAVSVPTRFAANLAGKLLYTLETSK